MRRLFLRLLLPLTLVLLTAGCTGKDNHDFSYSPVSPASDYYYPPLATDDWEVVSPASLGWDEAKLAEAIDYIGQKNSTAFIILYKGRIVVEQYWQGWDIHTADTIASAAKSITSTLIGMAQEQGYLNIQDKVSDYIGTGWSSAPVEKENLITVWHLLTMTSGLYDDLSYEADAGTVWYYNNEAYHVLWPVLEAASGMSLTDFTQQNLWSPTGMRNCFWGSASQHTSGRDMARFGLLILGNGAWNGQEVIRDKTFLADATDTSQPMNEAYGYLWWLNGKETYMLPGSGPYDGKLIPSAPEDMFAALGKNDRKIYVVPGMHLVVVRHGESAGIPASAVSSFDEEIWQRLVQVFAD